MNCVGGVDIDMSSVGEAVLLMLEWVLTSLFFDLESMEFSSELLLVWSDLLGVLDKAGCCCGDF